jgi:hypothetical protein
MANEWDQFKRAEQSEWDQFKPVEQAKPKRPEWSDLPGNILPSAGRFVGGIAEAVTSPVQTAKGLLDLGAGALRNMTPQALRNVIDKADANPANAQRASAAATAVGQHYADRYGSLEGARNALITDPVGVAADASTVLGGGAGLASKAKLGKTANLLQAASDATNPLAAVAPVVRGVSNAVGGVAKPILGLTTGTSAENIGQAYKAGKTGNKDFIANMRGDVAMTDVLDRLKQGLQNMSAAKSAEYRANMASVSKDKTVLDFAGIDKAISDAANLATYKGQVKNPKAAAVVQKMAGDVAEWKNLDPAQFHTPEGLDALKQRIGAALESIPFEEKTARLAAGKVYQSIKDEIGKQAPTYSDTMKAYSEASETITEIERALSAGNKASKDTAMRKLQSLMRNNANTNYGNRLELARTVERQGGVDLQPALAGQAMNSWAPRSLTGQGAGIASLGASLAGHPGYLLAMPFQSPRAVGLGAYGLGSAGRGTNALMDAAGLTFNDLAAYGLGIGQAQRLQDPKR